MELWASSWLLSWISRKSSSRSAIAPLGLGVLEAGFSKQRVEHASRDGCPSWWLPRVAAHHRMADGHRLVGWQLVGEDVEMRIEPLLNILCAV